MIYGERNLHGKRKSGRDLKLRIKYFEGATKLKKINKGNWIDVYSNTDIFIPVGSSAMIPLGFALELPQGYEGHLAPRSSTFKTWGVVQTNGVGIVDNSYCGDNDQWHMPVFCLEGRGYKYTDQEVADIFFDGNYGQKTICRDYTIHRYGFGIDEKTLRNEKGTWIRKGDKIGQFRIMEIMPEIEFEEVDSFGNKDRGGFGSTGKR